MGNICFIFPEDTLFHVSEQIFGSGNVTLTSLFLGGIYDNRLPLKIFVCSDSGLSYMEQNDKEENQIFHQFYNIVPILEAVLVLVYSLARKLCTYAVVAFQMDPGISCFR